MTGSGCAGVAEAEHIKLDMTYRSGETLAALLDRLYATPAAVLTQAAPLMPTSDWPAYRPADRTQPLPGSLTASSG
jgi:hypothetical protein